MPTGTDLLLIHPPYHRRAGSGSSFPLGLGYLAAAARASGYSVSLMDGALHCDSLAPESLLRFREWAAAAVRRTAPRLAVGIGPCTTPTARALEVLAAICEEVIPDIPVVYGGPLASIPEQEWFFFERLRADAVIVGDGETPLVALLSALAGGSKGMTIPGVAYPGDHGVAPHIERNLDRLPFPARDLGARDGYYLSVRRDLGTVPFATLVGSRGCPFRCRFCTSAVFRGGQYSRRSFGNIGAELAHLANDFGVRCVVFYDDTLFPRADEVNQDMIAFANAVRSVRTDMVWQFEIRPDIACKLEPDAIECAYDAGCRQVNLGIEKSDARALGGLGKGGGAEQSMAACSRIADAAPRMRIAGTFILGGPGENTESVRHTVEFSRSLGLTFAHFSPLELYPGTDLYREVFGNCPRRWYTQTQTSRAPWGEVVFESAELPGDRLLELVSWAYREFYGDPLWRKRVSDLLGPGARRVEESAKQWGIDRLRLG